MVYSSVFTGSDVKQKLFNTCLDMLDISKSLEALHHVLTKQFLVVWLVHLLGAFGSFLSPANSEQNLLKIFVFFKLKSNIFLKEKFLNYLLFPNLDLTLKPSRVLLVCSYSKIAPLQSKISFSLVSFSASAF